MINTGYKPDPFRLLTMSEDTKEEAKIILDPDTTFLEFKEQVIGKNLEVLFEDVPVTDPDNKLSELITGVDLDIKRAAPGTKVTISVAHDIETTITGIEEFVNKYNEIADSLTNGQYTESEEVGAMGYLPEILVLR